MVDAITQELSARVAVSSLEPAERSALDGLISGYSRDFHALVDQNDRIDELTAEMHRAAARITPLVAGNLEAARDGLATMTERLARDSEARARRGLQVAVAAAIGGALFAALMTLGIVGPVRRMAGMLDRLVHESPDERMPVDPKGRDEINHMALALNALADHRSRFVRWWHAEMQEVSAIRTLAGRPQPADAHDAGHELADARRTRQALLSGLATEIGDRIDTIDELAAQLGGASQAQRAASAASLHEAVADIRARIEMLDSG